MTDAAKAHPSLDPLYTAGSASCYAHEWTSAATGGKLGTHGRHFIDAYGRVCNLRGVNLSGCCKTPMNHEHDTFPHKHEEVTFVGRPFPLNEAHEHFSRLRRWGLTFVRFLVTWEAVEHAGPGIYDVEYLEYLKNVLSLLPQYGIKAFVSLHQDVWSRYSGGSGAPAWTLEAVGFDLHKLEESGAAWLKGVKGGGHVEAERGLWPCGYQKLAAATMATCFWAGDTFAPKLLIDGPEGQKVPVQEYLQNAFLNMYEVLARTVGHLEAVIGFEMMNEPHRGYIDLPSLHGFDYNTDLHLSFVPSAFQSFMLGSGYPTSIAHWTRSFPMPTKKTSHSVLNPAGYKSWRSDGPTGGRCVWEMHGVWGFDTTKKAGVVLRESYFSKHPMSGEKVDWYQDFYYPFLNKWTNRVRNVSPPEKLIFAEPIPNEFCPESWTAEHQPSNMVFAPHWYDLNALFAKAFGNFTVNVQGLSRGLFPLKAFYWGHKGARDNFALQLRNIVEAGYRSLGEKPVIIGECGVPMDMNRCEAFQSDNWVWQERMMDAMITGLDRALIGFTLWNYNPSNSDNVGDDWNGENFSWFSRSRALPRSLLYYDQDAPSLDNGARILPAIVRPYPAKTAGIPLRFEYEMNEGRFEFEWAVPLEEGTGADDKPRKGGKVASVAHPPLFGHPRLLTRETEIFVPSMLTRGRTIVVRGLNGLTANDFSYAHDEKRQTLFILPRATAPGTRFAIEVTLTPKLAPAFEVNDFWGDFGMEVSAGGTLVLAVVLFLLMKALS
ncbi:hypothetical protein HGRIS_012134 [Hohenbuehelia grisea]|uniref:Glycoside hydrolase family 5 C-terminal domain-containing protein n=1 Tax=Hohenbuehelia grisea TaxID=104357 RepID=A0ABR3IRF9_9AGAR